MEAKITIPEDISFSDLKLKRDPQTGAVSFDWAPILRICDVAGIDHKHLTGGPEDNAAGLIVAWYMRHREAGGEEDQTAEDLIAEVLHEDTHGGGHSHKPGHA